MSTPRDARMVKDCVVRELTSDMSGQDVGPSLSSEKLACPAVSKCPVTRGFWGAKDGPSEANCRSSSFTRGLLQESSRTAFQGPWRERDPQSCP